MSVLNNLHLEIIWTYRSALLDALFITLWLTAAASTAGIILGVILAVSERIAGRPMVWLVTAYVETFRNTPLLIQLMWVHFALPTLTGVPMTPSQSGLLTLTLSAGAYFTEIVRAGIAAVPRSQWEASEAIGLTKWLCFRLVVLPQALKIMIPPLVNMTVSVLKGTTIVSVLSIGEFLQVVNRISNYTFRTIEIFTFAALVYFAIGISLDLLARRLEKRLRHAER
ncbi:amino acid ABC transporter permease [Microvirga massiliensis]|uniref:amino acid ABC transporter permease n=1 Tax=Microvirga massiliensis TaxID=1033741 RepID=UPI00062B8340|nr:amino acid ABC transporter permease [Microvirga massiliensis]